MSRNMGLAPNPELQKAIGAQGPSKIAPIAGQPQPIPMPGAAPKPIPGGGMPRKGVAGPQPMPQPVTGPPGMTRRQMPASAARY